MQFLLCLISTGLQNHNTSSVRFPWPKMCAAKTNRYRHLPRLVVSVTGVTRMGRGLAAAWVQGFGGSPVFILLLDGCCRSHFCATCFDCSVVVNSGVGVGVHPG